MKIGTLVTLTLLLLCGFAGAQNTFCAANQPCNVTGNWVFLGPNAPITPGANIVFTGENRNRAADGTYYTSPELDGPGGVSGLNLDMCTAISQGWPWAVAKAWKGGVVDARAWHGVQVCATANIFAGYPFVAGQNVTFSGSILLAPDVHILIPNMLIMPSSSAIDGFSPHANCNPPFSPESGACIGPTNAFPVNTPIIEYAATNAGGSAPSQGIHLLNLGVTCRPPNGTFIAGSIGIRNQFAQDTSGGDQLFIDGCWADLNLEQGGTEGGSQNTGAWTNIHMAMSGVTDVTASCIKVGAAGVFAGPVKGIGPVSCVNTSGILLNVGVQIDGPGVVVHDSHIESFNKAVVVGANHAVTGGALRDIYCVPSVFAVNTCVELMSPNVSSFEIENLHGFSPITNLLVDHNPNGGTIAFSAETHLTFYARGGGSGTAGNNNVLTTSTQVPSVISQTAPAEIFRTTDYTTSAADNGKLISFNCSTPCTFTLPSTVPFTGWGVRVLNFGSAATTVNVNGVNTNGVPNNIVLRGGTSSSINISGLSTSYHYQPGASSGAFQVSACQNNATGSNVTVSTEGNLLNCTIPAALLATGNKLTCHVGFQRNTPAAGMVYKWYFGATGVAYASTPSTSQTGDSTMTVFIKSATAEQMNLSPLLIGSTLATGVSMNNQPAEAVSGAITVRFTGLGSDANNVLQTSDCVVTP